MGRGRKRLRRKSGESLGQHLIQSAKEAKEIASNPDLWLKEDGYVPELMQVPPEDIETVWPLVEELIGSEMMPSDWTSPALRHLCESGNGILWFVCDSNDEAIAALVTVRSPYDRCVVAICSGKNLFDFIEARHQLYAWAEGQGMTEVRFYGRPALHRLMPECKQVGVILTKEL